MARGEARCANKVEKRFAHGRKFSSVVAPDLSSEIKGRACIELHRAAHLALHLPAKRAIRRYTRHDHHAPPGRTRGESHVCIAFACAVCEEG